MKFEITFINDTTLELEGAGWQESGGSFVVTREDGSVSIIPIQNVLIFTKYEEGGT